jgi:Leucine-rich repeat (LRR) protein
MKIRILKKSKDDLNVYTVKNSNISYEELEELLNTYDKVIITPRLDWGNRGILSLPKNFGNLEVEDNLNLRYNKLTSLPESFGNLKVGGGLYLDENKLTSLPESFGNLKVGGYLGLAFNQLTSLPESFGNLEIGGNLNLAYNRLTSLPESFGNIKVRDKLWLQSNPWIIDTNFVNFYEKYKGKLVLGRKAEKETKRFIKLKEWEE